MLVFLGSSILKGRGVQGREGNVDEKMEGTAKWNQRTEACSQPFSRPRNSADRKLAVLTNKACG